MIRYLAVAIVAWWAGYVARTFDDRDCDVWWAACAAVATAALLLWLGLKGA